MTTLDHALRLCELLALDLARLAIEQPSQFDAEMSEDRLRIANRLRFIRGITHVPASEVVHEFRDVDGVVVAVFKSTPSVPASKKV